MSNLTAAQQNILKEAEAIYASLFNSIEGSIFDAPERAINLFRPRLAAEEREHFDVLFLTNKNSMIAVERLFSGTINQTSVYPREIVKRALELNAAAIILAHNHPSGNPEISRSDIAITKQIKSAAELIDVRVLDHIIITAGGGSVSLVQAGHV